MKSKPKKAKSLPSFRPNLDSPIDGEVAEFEESDDHHYQYTSLRDIMLHQGSPFEGGSMFDSSTISIRNELVKHAASAYVQSAAIVANRDPDWVAGVWEKVKNFFGFTSCWHAHIKIPFHAFFRTTIRFLDYFVNRIARD